MSEPNIRLAEWTWPEATYVCKALIRYEPDYGGHHLDEGYESGGMYIAYCENLPGCVTQGETYEEALAMLKEAFQLHIESYLADGMEIPWADCKEERWEREVSFAVPLVVGSNPTSRA